MNKKLQSIARWSNTHRRPVALAIILSGAAIGMISCATMSRTMLVPP